MGGVTGRIFDFGWGLLWSCGMRLYVPFKDGSRGLGFVARGSWHFGGKGEAMYNVLIRIFVLERLWVWKLNECGRVRAMPMMERVTGSMKFQPSEFPWDGRELTKKPRSGVENGESKIEGALTNAGGLFAIRNLDETLKIYDALVRFERE